MPKISTALEHTIKNNNTICYVAGRSGGHLLPAITLAQQHKEKRPNDRIVFITTAATLDKAIINEHKFIDAHEILNIGNLPTSIWRYPVYLFSLAKAFFRCIKILKTESISTAISTGGYVLLPVSIAAKLLAIPVVVYELNALPGKAVKILAPLITSINTCFKTTQNYLPKHQCTVGTYPLKFKIQDRMSKEEARAQLKLTSNRKTIFILGGSQGSLFINNTIKKWLEKDLAHHQQLQIIHQIGSHDQFDWQGYYKNIQIPAIVFNFTNNLATHYNAADIIICRSGAGTLFETVFFNKPCITIPLETKQTDHQLFNAQAMHKQYPHLVSLLTQSKLKNNPQELAETIAHHLSW